MSDHPKENRWVPRRPWDDQGTSRPDTLTPYRSPIEGPRLPEQPPDAPVRDSPRPYRVTYPRGGT